MTAQMHELKREATAVLLQSQYARELPPPNNGGAAGRPGRKCIVEGKRYDSTRKASRGENVSEHAIRRRIAAGVDGYEWA